MAVTHKWVGPNGSDSNGGTGPGDEYLTSSKMLGEIPATPTGPWVCHISNDAAESVSPFSDLSSAQFNYEHFLVLDVWEETSVWDGGLYRQFGDIRVPQWKWDFGDISTKVWTDTSSNYPAFTHYRNGCVDGSGGLQTTNYGNSFSNFEMVNTDTTGYAITSYLPKLFENVLVHSPDGVRKPRYGVYIGTTAAKGCHIKDTERNGFYNTFGYVENCIFENWGSDLGYYYPAIGDGSYGLIKNCIFIGDGTTSGQHAVEAINYQGVEIYNCIFVDLDTPLEVHTGYDSAFVRAGHNAFFNCGTAPYTKVLTGHEFDSPVIWDLGNDIIVGSGDPFVNMAGGDFRLKADSPLRGAGFVDQPMFSGTAGCYQQPLRCDIGPIQSGAHQIVARRGTIS